ncbi:MAG: lipopolysaccharide biosynthesis protein [Muribaculaceae bacterium]|nr:lipopolysaccharide biosynthesis protein [Muribaculaceae bacterium]
MARVKSLFKDTAIYGLSSIVGRFLNWCLVPMYTYCFTQAEFGIVTNLYAYVALALIILTYGMETGFFRFANHERWTDPGQVYTTTLISILTTSVIFMIAGSALSPEIARWLDCGQHPSYIWMMVLAVGLDAITSIPFAYLRYRSRPVRFATLKFINIGLNIGLNLFFILLCPWLWSVNTEWVSWFYDPSFGVGYIFLANLLSSLAILFLTIPELVKEPFDFNGRLLREMLRYSYPLLILGIAGIMNQTIDKILYPMLVPDKATAMADLGVYGANYKIAIVMVMFIQAFRFAYEPFIFAQNRKNGSGEADADGNRPYIDAMNWFVIFGLFIFLGVMFFLPVIKYFISPAYFAGLKVVPVIMFGELFFGIFFNLSLWYKISDRTIWGTWFSLFGLGVTLILNVVFVPIYGYMACAWAAFTCYGLMMVASYVVGRFYKPIDYDLRRLGAYLCAALLLWGASALLTTGNNLIDLPLRVLLLAVYAGVVYMAEFRRPRRKAIA